MAAPRLYCPGATGRFFEHWYRYPEAAASKAVPDLDYKEPFPVEGKAGDVIFMHYLCAHAGSENHDTQVRYGLNSDIVVDEVHPYERRPTAPAGDWTPLDYTLRTDNLN